MVRRLIVSLVLLVVVVVLLFAGGPLRAVPPWVMFGYLLWRALPGVVQDVRGVRGRLPVASLRGLKIRGGRGERL